LTENDGAMTIVTVEALDPNGARLNFANMIGRVARPDGDSEDIEFVQTAPGLYQARFKSEVAGQYLMNLRYAAPDGEGGQIEGNAYASISRPFADEFRALSDNAALLAQVADITGGRVLPESPQSPGADLWRRAGVEMPIATSPFWLLVAMIGIGMFLVDVAVRRVRIDLVAIGRSAVGAFKLSTSKAGQQMESLHEAREKAKRRMEQAGDSEGQEVASETKPRDKKAAAVKFEATEDQLRSSKSVSILDTSPTIEKPGKSQPKTDDEEEQGMSRLLKAKRRARDEFEE